MEENEGTKEKGSRARVVTDSKKGWDPNCPQKQSCEDCFVSGIINDIVIIMIRDSLHNLQ